MRETLFILVGRQPIAAALIVAAGLFQPALMLGETPPPANKLVNLDRPLVIAHRGYSAVAPENTLPAFELANAAGADLVELDYHHSKDGQLIVIHDYDLDRTTDSQAKWGESKVRVSDCSLDRLRALDAGSWLSPRFRGTTIPTLNEAITLIQHGSVTLIERKAGDAAACVDLLQARRLVNHVVVQAFDWDYLREFHRLEPRQILGALGPPGSRNGKRLSDEEKKLNKEWLHEIAETGATVVGWNKSVTRESIKEAHAMGLKVWVYTINNAQDANELLDMHVDGIITDNPALIWRTLALRRQSE